MRKDIAKHFGSVSHRSMMAVGALAVTLGTGFLKTPASASDAPNSYKVIGCGSDGVAGPPTGPTWSATNVNGNNSTATTGANDSINIPGNFSNYSLTLDVTAEYDAKRTLNTRQAGQWYDEAGQLVRVAR